MKELKNKATKFLYELAVSEGLDKVKHPVFGVLMTQVIKLLAIVDDDEGKITKVEAILNRVKEEWNAD